VKLNYKRTICVGFAFFLICAFWQAYDNTIPLILTNKFGMSQWGTPILTTIESPADYFTAGTLHNYRTHRYFPLLCGNFRKLQRFFHVKLIPRHIILAHTNMVTRIAAIHTAIELVAMKDLTRFDIVIKELSFSMLNVQSPKLVSFEYITSDTPTITVHIMTSAILA